MPNCRGAYAPQGVQPEARGGRPALPAGSAHSNAPSLSPHSAAGGPVTAFLLYRQDFNIFLQRLQGKSAGDLTIFLRYIIIIAKKAALRQSLSKKESLERKKSSLSGGQQQSSYISGRKKLKNFRFSGDRWMPERSIRCSISIRWFFRYLMKKRYFAVMEKTMR